MKYVKEHLTTSFFSQLFSMNYDLFMCKLVVISFFDRSSQNKSAKSLFLRFLSLVINKSAEKHLSSFLSSLSTRMTTPQVLNNKLIAEVNNRYSLGLAKPFEALLAKAKRTWSRSRPLKTKRLLQQNPLWGVWRNRTFNETRLINDTLTGFWKFLVAKDKYEEMFLLCTSHPDNCPSYRVSTITRFLGVAYHRWREMGQNWFRIIDRSVQMSYKMLFFAVKHKPMPYIHVKPGNPITSKRVTWPRGKSILKVLSV